ncbi:FHA domain-containing protein [Thermogemmatispora onikobensis]|uniref:FHA domain-containing protein n=1 Tax=Thermogemmatispora onikobensis TaxID=732234 RepID=UPI000852A347|nr:FHA domain-containing protein [Thermogemmatispora onikobensis]
MAGEVVYKALGRRGTRRQLAGALLVEGLSALLIAPALIWFYLRFIPLQPILPPAEVAAMLAYVALCGWGLPLTTALGYTLFATPASVAPKGTRALTRSLSAPQIALSPARYAPHPPGVTAPFVFNADTPWGWLEHRNGRLQGQRLALTRAFVRLGRGEENDIWLDDDLASRYHAELLWENGQAYVIDCQSLNGVFVNGQRVSGSAPVRSGDMLEIGSLRFLFELATPTRPAAPTDDDPLLRHPHPLRPVRLRKSETATPGTSSPVTPSPLTSSPLTPPTPITAWEPPFEAGPAGESEVSLRQTPLPPFSATPQTVTAPSEALPALHPVTHLLLICNGTLVGRSFVCNGPALVIGADPGCEVSLPDPSLAPRHALLLVRSECLYLQDLAAGATLVNGEPLSGPRLLESGDLIQLGAVLLQYRPLVTSPTAGTRSEPSASSSEALFSAAQPQLQPQGQPQAQLFWPPEQ